MSAVTTLLFCVLSLSQSDPSCGSDSSCGKDAYPVKSNPIQVDSSRLQYCEKMCDLLSSALPRPWTYDSWEEGRTRVAVCAFSCYFSRESTNQ